MTYGEVAPQAYRSRVETPLVGWSIALGRHRHISTQEAGRTSLGLARRKPDPVHHANASVSAQHLPTGHNYLMIWIPADTFANTRIPPGFGVTDMIGTDPPLHRRVIQWITGR